MIFKESVSKRTETHRESIIVTEHNNTVNSIAHSKRDCHINSSKGPISAYGLEQSEDTRLDEDSIVI